ncbi:hypothetical protein ACI65C_004940 [Semiaphis heraclei]
MKSRYTNGKSNWNDNTVSPLFWEKAIVNYSVVNFELRSKRVLREVANEYERFPKDIYKRTVWLNELNLTSVPNWKKVCSEHFSPNDFIFSNNRNIFQTTAVPTRYSKLMEEHSYADNVSISSPCLTISDRSPSTSRTKSYENANVVDVYDSSPSTFRTKSYENANVVKTSRPPLFNLCTDVEVITPPRKKRIWNPSRLGDLSDEDFSTPKRRKKNLCLPLLHHDYFENVENLNPYIEDVCVYIAGFVTMKAIKKIACTSCTSYLLATTQNSKLATVKDRGSLIKPSLDVQTQSNALTSETKEVVDEVLINDFAVENDCDQRVKERATWHPPYPTSIRDLMIPDQYKCLSDGSQFLLHDSGVHDDERFIIVGSMTGLRALSMSARWHADCTFKTTPLIFKQLYSIHAEIRNNSLVAEEA